MKKERRAARQNFKSNAVTKTASKMHEEPQIFSMTDVVVHTRSGTSGIRVFPSVPKCLIFDW